jgi:hypothetical protein
MSLRRAVYLVLTGIVLSGGLGKAQSSCPANIRTGDFAKQFVVCKGTVMMPVGAFLLVRKNGKIGAIRITSIDPAATDVYGKFTYESYFLGDGTSSSTSSSAIRQTDELNLKYPTSLGRIVFSSGKSKAKIGKWPFVFIEPGLLDMTGVARWSGGDHGYEFAPTSAHDVSEIDATDKRLRWFRYDPNASVILPLADLPN